mmetsp:Transcript_8627/g.27511  ORF Transcript_8627/g.27511 Transcript_8627/m.27511 type:complete len:945 (-) Transcript_8627:33-2867(-)
MVNEMAVDETRPPLAVVRTQGTCGSCYAVAVGTTVEIWANMLRNRRDSVQLQAHRSESLDIDRLIHCTQHARSANNLATTLQVDLPFVPSDCARLLDKVLALAATAQPPIAALSTLVHTGCSFAQQEAAADGEPRYRMRFDFYEAADGDRPTGDILADLAAFLPGRSFTLAETTVVDRLDRAHLFFPSLPVNSSLPRYDDGWPFVCLPDDAATSAPVASQLVTFPVRDAFVALPGDSACDGGYVTDLFDALWWSRSPDASADEQLRGTTWANVDDLTCVLGEVAEGGAEFDKPDAAAEDVCVFRDERDTPSPQPPTPPAAPTPSPPPPSLECPTTVAPEPTQCRRADLDASRAAEADAPVLYSLLPDVWQQTLGSGEYGGIYTIYSASPSYPVAPDGTFLQPVSAEERRTLDETQASIMAALDVGPAVLTFGVCPSHFSPTGAANADAPVQCVGREDGAHAVALVGYVYHADPALRAKNSFIIQNSWGSGWGDRGFGYLQMDALKVYSVSVPLVRLSQSQTVNPLLPPLGADSFSMYPIDPTAVTATCDPPCLAFSANPSSLAPSDADDRLTNLLARESLGVPCRKAAMLFPQPLAAFDDLPPTAMALAEGETVAFSLPLRLIPAGASFARLRFTFRSFLATPPPDRFPLVNDATGKAHFNASSSMPEGPLANAPAPRPATTTLRLLATLDPAAGFGDSIDLGEHTLVPSDWTDETLASGRPSVSLSLSVRLNSEAPVSAIERLVVTLVAVASDEPRAVSCTARIPGNDDWRVGTCRSSVLDCPADTIPIVALLPATAASCQDMSQSCAPLSADGPSPVCCTASSWSAAAASPDFVQKFIGVTEVAALDLDLNTLDSFYRQVQTDADEGGLSPLAVALIVAGVVVVCSIVAVAACLLLVVAKRRSDRQAKPSTLSTVAQGGSSSPPPLHRRSSSRSRRMSQSRR